jgi:hypothetical protein
MGLVLVSVSPDGTFELQVLRKCNFLSAKGIHSVHNVFLITHRKI